jgi:hypothetical protein
VKSGREAIRSLAVLAVLMIVAFARRKRRANAFKKISRGVARPLE